MAIPRNDLTSDDPEETVVHFHTHGYAEAGPNQSENQNKNGEETKENRDGWYKLSGTISMYSAAPLQPGTPVYKAEQTHGSGKIREVVAKLIPKDKNHEREIDILLNLDDHPNIVKIIDSGDIPGLIPQLYVVMERCHQNLKQYIKDKKSQQLSVPIPKAKSFFKQMISAIVFIHGRKIIHRDLKPSNILICSDEESLKVADFGISREIPEDRTKVTVTNSEAGTEGYKPPEAYQGATKIGYKADVFQMGLIGYYIFTTGQHPFGEDCNIQAVNIKKNNAPDFRGILHLPGPLTSLKIQLTDLLQRMLAHIPANRHTAEQASKDDFFKDDDKPCTSTSLDQTSSKPSSYNIIVQGDLHFGGDMNQGSTGRTEDYRGAAIQTLNKGHLETTNKDCTSVMKISHLTGGNASSDG